MKKQLKSKWLAALRSGKYAQGRGKLKWVSDRGRVEYCCLGVLCEVAEIEATYVDPWANGQGTAEFEGCTSILNDDLLQRLGLDWEFAEKLIDRNDGRNGKPRRSFKQIASYIARYL